MTIAGQVDDAGSTHPARLPEVERRAVKAHLAICASEACQRPQERALAVAFDAGEPDHLARLDAQRNIVEAATPQRDNLEQRRGAVRLGALGRKGLVDRAADDQPQDLPFGDLGHREGAARLAVAQDRQAVRDRRDLGQAVGDVDDRRAVLADRADVLE